jgi:hypothetical protein
MATQGDIFKHVIDNFKNKEVVISHLSNVYDADHVIGTIVHAFRDENGHVWLSLDSKYNHGIVIVCLGEGAVIRASGPNMSASIDPDKAGPSY